MVEQKTQQQILQDLIWVIKSPVLFSHQITEVKWIDDSFCQASWLRCKPHIDEIRSDLNMLNNYTLSKPNSFRLGHYFEYLVSLWMSIDPRFEIIAQNQVIQDGSVTRGELDFVLFDIETKKRIHLEVAIKFYIGLNINIENKLHEGSSGIGYWYGPGLKDRLDKKYAAMQWKQIPLGLEKDEPNMPWQIDESVGLMKGRVFCKDNIKPLGMSEHAVVGDVLTLSEAQQSTDLIIADKHDWIGLEELRSSTRSLEHVPVQALHHDNFCFVVPDDWYQSAELLSKKETEQFRPLYENAEYYIESKKVAIDKPYMPSNFMNGDEVYLITAFNPMHIKSTDAQNIRRNKHLKKWLKESDLKFYEALGKSTDDEHCEPSFAVEVHTKAERLKVFEAANLFGQRAILKFEKGCPAKLIWQC